MKVQREGSCTTRDTTGNLSNAFSESSGCGAPSRPWILQVQTTQTINVSLLDFGVYTNQDTDVSSPVGCVKYGYIREGYTGRRHNICGGTDRHKHVLTSQSNKLEIYMFPPSDIGDVHFVLQYEGKNVTYMVKLALPVFFNGHLKAFYKHHYDSNV